MPKPARTRIANLLFGTLLCAAAFALPAGPVLAYRDPPNASQEAGGVHFRIPTSEGPVHVWHPANFDPSTARTIVYVHGYHMYDDVVEGRPIGSPPTYKIDYREHVDYVWDGHDLAEKFAASGINALFIVPDAWKDNGTGNLWTSLSSLLDTVKTKTGIEPPGNVFAMAHSGGIFTLRHWYDNPRLTGIVLLDALYDNLSALNGWISQSGHAIAIVPAGGGASKTGEFIDDHKNVQGTVYTKDFPNALSTEQKAAKVLIIDGRGNLSHMGLVEGASVIPVMLARFGEASGAGAGGGSSDALAGDGGGSGSLVTLESADIPLVSPRLEVAIPGVDFSAPFAQDGAIIAPYLAQYIAGVYAFLISIVGVVAALVLIHGGFLYLTAGGAADRVGKAREKITNAMIGLALTFGSYTVLYVINPATVRFESFGLLSVQSVLYNTDRVNAENEGGLIEAGESTSEGSVTAGSSSFPTLPAGGKPQNVCSKSGSPRPCSDFCQMPRDKSIVDDDTGRTVKISSQWPEASNGMANPSVMVKIEGLKGVSSSQRTDPRTFSLLKRAGEIASDTNELARIGVSGGPYVINVTSGYRPLWKQIDLACAAEGGTGSNIGSTLATPGSSLHGAGFALDIALVKGGTVVSRSGNSQAQQYPKWRDGAIKLAKIMFAAGFRRLNNEIWHFEPADAPAPSCRCYKLSECTFPAQAGSEFYRQVQAKEEAINAESDGTRKKRLAEDLKAFLNVKNSASPIGCGKRSNYDNE